MVREGTVFVVLSQVATIVYICVACYDSDYTPRQINLYRMFFADCQFSTNFHEILQGLFESSAEYPESFIEKYSIAQKLDHLACYLICKL